MAGMGLAGEESARFRLVSECAGFSTIGEPSDGTFSSVERTGYGSDVYAFSVVLTGSPVDRGLSMLILTAFPASVDSVCGRGVRSRLPNYAPELSGETWVADIYLEEVMAATSRLQTGFHSCIPA